MKITDKMRLDWLRKERRDLWATSQKSWVVYQFSFGVLTDDFETPREAIDAAIRAERKRRKK